MQPYQKLTGKSTDSSPAEKSAGGSGREYGDSAVSIQYFEQAILISLLLAEVFYSAYTSNTKLSSRTSVHLF
jgi:hypothetical protein